MSLPASIEYRVAICGTPKLARAARRRFPHSLAEMPFFLPTIDTALRRSLDGWLDERGILPNVVAELEDSAPLVELGALGGGGTRRSRAVSRAVPPGSGRAAGREPDRHLEVPVRAARTADPLALAVQSSGAMKLTSWLLSSVSMLAVACGTDTGPDPDPEPDPAGAPTYWQHVEPIFATNCASCHTEGDIGPFAIDDPEIAIGYASRIAAETAARRMPPWPPGGDTPALAHVRTLTQAQIDTIAAWAAAGAPLGDPSRPQPHEPPEAIDLGATELGFDLGVDYVPDGALTDDYRCFLVDLGATTPRMATGFRITPGNRATVHHVIVSLFAGADRAALQALDAETPGRAGWPCVGGPVPGSTDANPVGALGSWVPGVSAVAYPTGTGQLVPAGALAVVQMHYNLLGGMAPDRTRVDVALAPPEATTTLIRLGGLALIKRNLQIAANDPASVHTQSATVQQWRALRGLPPFPASKGYALGAGGHMHLVGRRITITRSNAGGDTVLLDIPAWSFHWQGQYEYQTPIEVANTDTLTIRCEYDNSNEHRLALGLDPNTPVTWGEGTQDEMCLASVQLVERLP